MHSRSRTRVLRHVQVNYHCWLPNELEQAEKGDWNWNNQLALRSGSATSSAASSAASSRASSKESEDVLDLEGFAKNPSDSSMGGGTATGVGTGGGTGAGVGTGTRRRTLPCLLPTMMAVVSLLAPLPYIWVLLVSIV